MAERKAVNKYYPPDWDPRKGSVNRRVGQHPLRDRAKKLSQGILVIRFELPYNIWCGGCGIHVGMGVRYNAEKSKVGNYYSTPIYKFRMKCHLCDNYFEIQTDPKNHDYVILNGARRKEQRWDPVDNGQIMPEDKATQKKLATDPMYKLEHCSDDHQKGKEQVTNLAQLEETRISMIDDYLLNRMARDKFRSEKQQLKEAAEADKAILDKSALDIDLVQENEEDRRLATLLRYSVTTSFEDKQKDRRKSIEQKPIFATKKGGSILSSSASSALISSSSSSELLFQSLPYQRHAKPQLSHRGEIKQRLGWAIKASYKDPFKSTGKEDDTVSLLVPANAMQKQLGIKLKSSSPDKLPHKTLATKDGSRSSDYILFSKSNTVSSIHQKDACEIDTEDKKQCALKTLSPSCYPANQSPSDNVDAIPKKVPSPVSKSSASTALNSNTESSSRQTRNLALSTYSSKEEGASNSQSNSGLLTLISSYIDSDSSSND